MFGSNKENLKKFFMLELLKMFKIFAFIFLQNGKDIKILVVNKEYKIISTLIFVQTGFLSKYMFFSIWRKR